MATPAFFIASACGIVRGKPSKRYPFLQSRSFSRSLTRPMMMSSETSWPASMTFFAATPSGVPALTAARSMSPVEICGIPNFSQMKPACVPLPAPGGPRRIKRITAASCQHSTDGLQVLGRVDARRDLGYAHCHGDAMAVPQHPQLLERLGLLEGRGRERSVALQEIDAISVDPGVPVADAALFPRIRNSRAREVQRVAVRVHDHLHHVRTGEGMLVVDRMAGGGDRRVLELVEELRYLRDELGRDQRLVALNVHHDVAIPEFEKRNSFGYAVGAGRMIGTRHHAPVARGPHRGGDALVVGGHMDRRRAALRCPLADPHHHGPPGDVGERLSRKPARRVAGRDEDVEAQATSSSGGSLRASSSSITGMPSFTG